ncbi:putative oxidoreductase, FAD-binding [Sclerotinia borealis F-4128]|uniref:Putative oxidoreductase, FAD-binding n=1 Tax=Sclerotinia borealis (strain F-4128) TaxID=1432307 RepID=W9C5L6_SCLBF|nr:putative oxidoreductase, FAD-binding [Sclerotinia borealis F-4128]
MQERLSPACIVKPTCSQDVSIIVAALAKIHSTDPEASLFAIRSGGHTPFAGAANDNGGVTIDLTLLNSTAVSKDYEVISVGAGSIWNNIYEKLDPRNLTAVGERVAGIGVGGLLTGGGISFFSSQYGWACDNIEGMEIVVANGSIVYASAFHNTDLSQAMK